MLATIAFGLTGPTALVSWAHLPRIPGGAACIQLNAGPSSGGISVRQLHRQPNAGVQIAWRRCHGTADGLGDDGG